MSIASELANCCRGKRKKGFEFTGSGSGFDRYMSCSQKSVACFRGFGLKGAGHTFGG